ncbi:adenosylhomocysteinase [Paenibacillus amylolyticus]|uniref:S-adenosyl-L-homocysteine hydrolase, NAD binding domain protein n=1 Tax=Paenibacillus amylolyticus TaxID=1451 RepID=A0A117I178_PAEAM|nr:adenosylhomocysteinase [Paenibacillus amylolyticus]GAS81784.1 S-adenosyl-L-homocysteine hydrolase, NAD binding domain protein [Paenibacillus amylolyticus]
MNSIIDDQSLASAGLVRMQWYRERMPLVTEVNQLFKQQQVLKGMTIAISMHIEPKTGFWVEGLLAGGAAHIYLVGCLGTTKKDTAAYLASLPNVTVLAKEGDLYEDHKRYLKMVMAHKIDLFLDNGASLILAHHELKPGWNPIGANEETRTGKLLIEKNGVQPDYPVIVIDDSPLKQTFENALGVGQSVVDGFMRTTSLLVGGKKVLVVGYGYCGSGIAKKFRGLGANTLVYDMNPVHLLNAKTDGHWVGELHELIPEADVIITATGSFNVITEQHIPLFKEKVILANSGHYGFEINVEEIKQASQSVEIVKEGIERISFAEKSIYLLHSANPVNLAGADGNPIEIMDMGFALISYSAYRIMTNVESLQHGLQPVPKDIDSQVSKLFMNSLQ